MYQYWMKIGLVGRLLTADGVLLVPTPVCDLLLFINETECPSDIATEIES